MFPAGCDERGLIWNGAQILKPLHTTIETILAEDPSAAPVLVNSWLALVLRERDPAAAERALAAMPPRRRMLRGKHSVS